MASVKKIRTTLHADKRLAERGGNAASVDDAYLYGKTWGELVGKDEPLSQFLRHKARFENKLVKYYEGYVYVFTRHSHKLITAYPFDREKENAKFGVHRRKKHGRYPRAGGEKGKTA